MGLKWICSTQMSWASSFFFSEIKDRRVKESKKKRNKKTAKLRRIYTSVQPSEVFKLLRIKDVASRKYSRSSPTSEMVRCHICTSTKHIPPSIDALSENTVQRCSRLELMDSYPLQEIRENEFIRASGFSRWFWLLLQKGNETYFCRVVGLNNLGPARTQYSGSFDCRFLLFRCTIWGYVGEKLPLHGCVSEMW